MSKLVKQILSLFLMTIGLIKVSRLIRVSLLKKPVLTILCYHRITDHSISLAPQCVTPLNFERHVAFFSRQFDIWPLSAVEEYLRGGLELRRDTLVFTFDDGYLDNYEIAMPVLMKYSIPAVFFVSAGPLVNREPYWIDSLNSYLCNLISAEAKAFIALNDNFHSLLNEYLRVGHDSRGAVARKILLYLKSADDKERHSIMAYISDCLKKRGEQYMDSQVLDLKQATDMVMNGFVIGAHTVSHPVLSKLDYNQCREEILDSISLLHNHGVQINCFAYPFGEDADIGDSAPRILKEAGIKIGVTTEEDVVSKKDNQWLLPRKVVSNQSVSQISLRLERLAWGI